MKIPFAQNRSAFTRPQALFVICLAILAFEFGARYAEKQYAETKAVETNSAPTNVLLTTAAPVLEEEELYFPPETNIAASATKVYRPRTNYVRPPTTPRTPPGVPEVLDASGPITRRKVPRPATNSYPYGIRIAVP